MRALIAKQSTTGKWFQRIDTSAKKTLAQFAEEVARQFGVAEAVVAGESREIDQAQYDAIKAALLAGSFDGSGVIPALKRIVAQPAEFRAALIGLLDGIDLPAQRSRAATLRMTKHNWVQPFLESLTAPYTADKEWWIQEWFRRAVAVVGTPDEVITAAERDRLLAAAPKYGIRLQ